MEFNIPNVLDIEHAISLSISISSYNYFLFEMTPRSLFIEEKFYIQVAADLYYTLNLHQWLIREKKNGLVFYSSFDL